MTLAMGMTGPVGPEAQCVVGVASGAPQLMPLIWKTPRQKQTTALCLAVLR